MSQRSVKKSISQIFKFYFRFIMAFGFIGVCLITFIMQSALSTTIMESNLNQAIEDTVGDLEDRVGLELLAQARTAVANLPAVPTSEQLTAYAKAHNIFALEAIGEDGIIFASNNPNYIGFDMASGEQSAEFLPLLTTMESYSQEMQGTTYDASDYVKYVGVATDYGFFQLGEEYSTYSKNIFSMTGNVTANRHVGTSGFVLVANSEGTLISEPKESDTYNTFAALSDISTMDAKALTFDKVFEADVYGQRCYCQARDIQFGSIISCITVEEVLYQARIMTLLSMALVIIVFVFIYFWTRNLLRRTVLDDMSLTKKTLRSISNGNLDVRATAGSTFDFVELSGDINIMVTALKDNIARERKRIDKDLAFAAQIQESALPRTFPAYPGRTEFDIFADMRPAKEVGGDFYDFFFVTRHRFAFLIADVSGKGIPGAMFMMQTKMLLKSNAEAGLSAAESFTRANAELCASNEAGMFVTVWMGIIDLKTGKVTYANAGHNPPLVRGEDGTFTFLRSRSGFVLAGMDDTRYVNREITLKPGDTIFLYTDGVTEAIDNDENEYGDDALFETVNRLAQADVKELCLGVGRDLTVFSKGAEQFDDVTMLAFHYKGDPHEGNDH